MSVFPKIITTNPSVFVANFIDTLSVSPLGMATIDFNHGLDSAAEVTASGSQINFVNSLEFLLDYRLEVSNIGLRKRTIDPRLNHALHKRVHNTQVW